MASVSFRRLELRFGRLSGGFDLSGGGGPVVIAGPNGSGKSTLMEALSRTLFGFDLKTERDRTLQADRHPWGHDESYGRLLFRGADGHDWTLERDFVTHEVRLQRSEGDEPDFQGDGNPAGSNLEVLRFRKRLRELFGFSDLATYEQTTCIHQGMLAQTRLSETLLEAASGGQVDVEKALEKIKESYRELTLSPIQEGDRAANKPRPIEELRAEIEDLSDRLLRVERAQQRREPLLRQQETLEKHRAELESEADLLQAATSPLSTQRALTLEARNLEDLIRELEEAEHETSKAASELEAAEAALAEALRHGEYPEDFPTRLGALEPLWSQELDLREEIAESGSTVSTAAESAPWALGASAGILFLGVALLGAGYPEWGEALAALGFVAGLFLWTRRRSARRQAAAARQHEHRLARRLETVETEVAIRLQGLPGNPDLAPATVATHRDRFAGQQQASERLESARRRQLRALVRGKTALERAGSAVDPLPAVDPGRADDPGAALRLAIGSLRNELAVKRHALEEIRVTRLPSGVEKDLDAVTRALAERRREIGEHDDRLRILQGEILESRPAESPVALGDRLDTLREELSGLERRAEEYRQAHSLLVEAHAQFRADDEKRLVGAVTSELEALSGGTFGPLVVPNGLESARLRAFGDREVPLNYRPLSFGEHLTVLLAVRLGIADFLAQAEIRVPLLLDEPFAHLDDDNACAVWNRLRAVSRDRQVILTTQESQLLERMGVEPDVRLGG